MPTPNLGLDEMPSNSFSPSIPFNANMQTIDALLPLVVESMSLTTPPATTLGDEGTRWIPATGATGAWASHDGEIALCVGADLWAFIAPPAYISLYDIATDADYRNMPGGWTVI